MPAALAVTVNISRALTSLGRCLSPDWRKLETMAPFSLAVLFAVHLFFFASAEIRLFELTTAHTNLSSTCINAVNQAVNCNSSLKWAGGRRYERQETLEGLCTTDCHKSLSQWQESVSEACPQRFDDGKGHLILPSFWIEHIVEHHNSLCLRNK